MESRPGKGLMKNFIGTARPENQFCCEPARLCLDNMASVLGRAHTHIPICAEEELNKTSRSRSHGTCI